MYIQITSKCNMACPHCAMSCSPRRGAHMTMDVFRRACLLAVEYGENITLGGGEPTLHPEFPAFFGIAVLHSEGMPLIITNGTNAALTLRLLNTEAVECRVSKDRYHDASLVDPKVYEVAKEMRRLQCGADQTISATGRGKGVEGAKKYCVCEDINITSNGDVYLCGCRKTWLGNIMLPNFGLQPILDARSDMEGEQCERHLAKKQREELVIACNARQ